VYKNQIEHDPLNIDRAREIASDTETIPVGILYNNPAVPCYEDLRLTDKLRTADLTRAGLNAELDKYTIWPQGAKQKVKQSLKQLAQDLLVLYSERHRRRGNVYSRDTVWQKQFEENFPYEETGGQIKSIEEIKADMESPKIMDRLLLGDVG